MILTVETEVLAAKPVTVPLCSQIQLQTDCDRDQASAVNIQLITAAVMIRFA